MILPDESPNYKYMALLRDRATYNRLLIKAKERQDVSSYYQYLNTLSLIDKEIKRHEPAHSTKTVKGESKEPPNLS